MQYKNSNDPAKRHASSLQRLVRVWVIPQGGTLIFSYISMLGPFLGVQYFEFHYSGGFQKMNIFGGGGGGGGGYDNLVDILFWGLQKF